MDNGKISIIIPIYNVEKYLCQCLNSIFSLDLSNKEVILVNDGSIDTSKDIAIFYKKKFGDRVILIHQENKGLSAARNIGLKKATGEYVYFIDSDDFVNTESLEVFFSEGLNLKKEMYIGNFKEYFSKEKIKTCYCKRRFVGKTGLDFLEFFLCEKMFLAVVWRTLYRRDFLLKYNLFFKEGLLHEDELFTLSALYFAEDVSYSEQNFYYYRKNNQESITKNKSIKNYEHILFTVNKLITLEKTYKKKNRYFNGYILKLYWVILRESQCRNFSVYRKLLFLTYPLKEYIRLCIILLLSINTKKIPIVDL